MGTWIWVPSNKKAFQHEADNRLIAAKTLIAAWVMPVLEIGGGMLDGFGMSIDGLAAEAYWLSMLFSANSSWQDFYWSRGHLEQFRSEIRPVVRFFWRSPTGCPVCGTHQCLRQGAPWPAAGSLQPCRRVSGGHGESTLSHARRHVLNRCTPHTDRSANSNSARCGRGGGHFTGAGEPSAPRAHR